MDSAEYFMNARGRGAAWKVREIPPCQKISATVPSTVLSLSSRRVLLTVGSSAG